MAAGQQVTVSQKSVDAETYLYTLVALVLKCSHVEDMKLKAMSGSGTDYLVISRSARSNALLSSLFGPGCYGANF